MDVAVIAHQHARRTRGCKPDHKVGELRCGARTRGPAQAKARRFLRGMRDMAVDAAPVFMAFEPARLPMFLGLANCLKSSRADGHARLGWMFVKSSRPKWRELPALLTASGKGRSNAQRLSGWNRLSGPTHWRLPIRRPLCYGITSPVRGFAVP